ncbi:MAG: TIGR02266 family protein [Polyangiales bacterium]
MSETRQYKRALVSLKVRFRSATVDDFIERYSIDISRGGLFIQSKNPMPIGTLLKFEFQLQDESRLIHGVGRVAWLRPASEPEDPDNPPGMGIKFIKMDPSSRALVNSIVEARGSSAGAFEEGSVPPPAAAEPAEPAPFFPETPADAPRPDPADSTQVRHASAFLASALQQGDAQVASEAVSQAEQAQARSHALQQRLAAEGPALRRSQRPDAPDAEGPRVGDTISVVPSATPSSAAAAPADTSAAWTPGEAAPTSTADHDDQAPTSQHKGAVAVPGAATQTTTTTQHGHVNGPSSLHSAPPPRAPRRGLWIAGGVLVVAAAAALIGWRWQQKTQREAAEKQQAAAAAARRAAAQATEAKPPKLVSMALSSDPGGAQVWLNGKGVGQTPMQVQLPEGQTSTVRVKAPGFAAIERRIHGRQALAPMQVVLSPLGYQLSVRTVPSEATVQVGSERHRSPVDITFKKPPRKALVVTITKSKHHRVRQRIEPDAFQDDGDAMRCRLEVDLQRRDGQSTATRPRSSDSASAAGGGQPAAGTTATGAGAPSGASGDSGTTSKPTAPDTAPPATGAGAPSGATKPASTAAAASAAPAPAPAPAPATSATDAPPP